MDCVFCKIAAGELPAFKVYEDDSFLVILDKFPKAVGHCQVIPKKHYRWVWDVPEVGAYMEVARKVALAQQKAFGTPMITSQILGDEVPHAHIWLVPQRHTQNTHLTGAPLAQAIGVFL